MAAGNGLLRRRLEALPPFPMDDLIPDELSKADGYALWRAYMLLSALSHAYVWCDGPEAAPVLPARLAQPWAAVSAALDMPPVGVYATYTLYNWRRLDPSGGIELGNIAPLYSYWGGPDEDWFKMVHVAIEAAAAPALAALPPLAAAASAADAAALEAGLAEVAGGLAAMRGLLQRMSEKCLPYIYFHRVRRPTSGWKGNDELPQGLLYEGVWQQPLKLYGGSGAQSSILPSMDAVLGVKHDQGWLREYLQALRKHMPPAHRAFISSLEAGPSVRAAAAAGPRPLRAAYEQTLLELERFRAQHRGFATAYISQISGRDAGERGTGGTRFAEALDTFKQDTRSVRMAARGAAAHAAAGESPPHTTPLGR